MLICAAGFGTAKNAVIYAGMEELMDPITILLKSMRIQMEPKMALPVSFFPSFLVPTKTALVTVIGSGLIQTIPRIVAAAVGMS